MSQMRQRQRRGIAIVPVLVCFVVITLICGTLLKTGLAQRDVIAAEEARLQTEWLVESGLERAAAKLAASRDYKGETWPITAEELNAPWPALVTITVERTENEPDQRSVTVRADYPREGDRRNRQSKQVTLPLGAATEKGKS